ncbi:MAG: prepilin-type N-terminal cleavage/methylation domain-containing protein [Terriglobales bacterium]|jgi:prepilin-type N-terminal cleavage/methylation domain-containing protein
MRKQEGFSLIELLIVVAIILVIAAIAIPNLLRARIAANESAAVSGVRTLNTAQISYYSAYPSIGYASALSNLGGSCTGAVAPASNNACLTDDAVASGSKSGYYFNVTNVTGNPATSYQISAWPTGYNQTGIRYFCSTQDAVVRVAGTTANTCAGTETALQ